MGWRNDQCKKVCRIIDNYLANRPTERDSLILAVRKAFDALEQAKTNCSEIPNNSDTISRQQAIDALRDYLVEKRCPDDGTLTCRLIENEVINKLPSIQPEIIRCKNCLMHGVCRFEQGLGLDGYCSQAKRRTDE